ncbi:hypothetical protein CCHR01_04147 [Colletotrichum chrysophilum]|uniref:Secreted protein n=1 Tax=Colletotrichum chrysophilum TaxID=1836956 RepID=A0AAD9EQR8_9PEZI|nr:hypothetical protein CCHR01_04147 [Colletotrichum chrysophilum]
MFLIGRRSSLAFQLVAAFIAFAALAPGDPKPWRQSSPTLQIPRRLDFVVELVCRRTLLERHLSTERWISSTPGNRSGLLGRGFQFPLATRPYIPVPTNGGELFRFVLGST